MQLHIPNKYPPSAKTDYAEGFNAGIEACEGILREQGFDVVCGNYIAPAFRFGTLGQWRSPLDPPVLKHHLSDNFSYYESNSCIVKLKGGRVVGAFARTVSSGYDDEDGNEIGPQQLIFSTDEGIPYEIEAWMEMPK